MIQIGEDKMKNVVVFGGGTGLSHILKGLKLFPVNVTAIISVSDNGSSTGILKKELNKVVDWRKVNKEDYLLAMERSPIKDTEIRLLLESALTDKINDREVFMKGIDVSYQYEGYNTYSIEELDNK